MDKLSFLNFKKPLKRTGAIAPANDMKIQFMVSDIHSPAAVSVKVVDDSLAPVKVDYRNYSGAVANCLKSFNQILENEAGRILWDKSQQDSIRLKDNPQLLYMLAMCNNVVDDKGNPITFSDQSARIAFRVTIADESCKTFFEATLPDGSTANPTFLTDSFIIAGSMVYPVMSTGDNYDCMEEFAQNDIPRNQLALYLSIVMSYVANVTPIIDGIDVQFSSSRERQVPTIVFEKVESDNALIVNVRPSMAGIPAQLLDKFDFSVVVNEVAGSLIVKDVEQLNITDAVNEVARVIDTSASNRRDAREVYRDGSMFIIPEQVAGNFIFRGLPTLLSRYRVLGTDKLTTYKVTAVTPRLKVNLSSGIDYLEGSAEVEVGNENITLSDLLKRYTRDHYIELADGTRAIIDENYMKRLERIFRHNRGDGDKLKISFFDLPEIEALLSERLNGKGIEKHRKVYEGFNNLSKMKVKTKELKAKLRPYQTDGVRWIKYLYDNNLGGCLADDMGLGKTIQTIAVLLQIYPAEKKPTLIVMPRSLIFNWENELDKFAPSLSHATYYGTGRNLDDAMKSQIILSTYAIVRNDIDMLRKCEFHYVILDESQNIKNIAAQITRSTYLLKADHRLAISGTPIENNLTELYSLFHFLNPTMFGTLDEFNQYYTYPIQRDGDELAAEQLRRKVFPFILRRLKKDVLKDLPDRVDQVMFAEMTPELTSFYERRRRFYYDQINDSIKTEGIQKSQMLILQALSELRRIASVPESLSDGQIHSPKLDLLVEQIESAVTNRHKVVVFFNFIAGMELAAEHLERNGIGYEMMSGATTNRRKVVDRFQNDPDCKVFLMTLKTGGVGLNLTVADTVIIFEPWWNKSAEEQAINRLHRIGQKATVMCYSLYTKGTIEEKIRELQEKKSLLVDAIISSDSGSGKQLTEDDINFILGPESK